MASSSDDPDFEDLYSSEGEGNDTSSSSNDDGDDAPRRSARLAGWLFLPQLRPLVALGPGLPCRLHLTPPRLLLVAGGAARPGGGPA